MNGGGDGVARSCEVMQHGHECGARRIRMDGELARSADLDDVQKDTLTSSHRYHKCAVPVEHGWTSAIVSKCIIIRAIS